ncbi:hypothetical protein LCGC14_2873100 [marine sediment metagenome]|uniref:Uncharacterized protein n=1 Tax=marine sediment metagenome TaxID=412755 RepID=A0A0F8Y2H9_9ZZZZ
MRVICPKVNICSEQCGAKKPHQQDDCEPCPFGSNVICVKVKTVLIFEGEEIEFQETKE